ncbi:MAG: site-specific integrase [Actinomycetaceae bacterium]|nr:site-specific integrase [Actinomycetaceae bacterium]
MAVRRFGTVEKLPSGRYRAYFELPDSGRKRIRAPYTFRNVTEARQWLTKQESALLDGTWKSPEQKAAEAEEAERKRLADQRPFGEYAEQWLALKEYELSPTTMRAYRANYRNHLQPKWGNHPIKQIETVDVRQWVAEELSPGKRGARERAYELFKAIMNTAVEDGIIAANPCTRNLLKKGASKAASRSQRHAPRALPIHELTALADEVPSHMRTLVLLMGIVGLRLGEARELRRKDINLTDHTISVTRAVSGDGKSKVVGTPKTDAGIRTVPLSDEMVELLRAHVEARPLAGKDALVFPSTQNPREHMGERTIQINIRRACERLGIPHASPHDFRHTAASIAGRVEGISPKDVQMILGQSTPGMALRYTHSDEETQRRIINSVARQVLSNDADSNVIKLDRKAE